MAQSGDTGATMYAGIGIVLLIALAALALFKFNMFHVADMLAGQDDNNSTSLHRGPSHDDGGAPADAGPIGEEPVFPAHPPENKNYAKPHTTPLPKTLTVKKQVNGETVEIEMCLVPQGWFQMGENDGVRSNMPKRWIWLDDYYIAKTEMTNQQFYGFILADGYRKSQYWTQEGYQFITNHVRNRGSSYIGWGPLERSNHLWALASPSEGKNESLTLEVLEPDRVLGAPDCTVLVLPQDDDAWPKFLNVSGSGDNVQVRMKFRDTWKDVTGSDIRNDTDHKLKEAGYLRFTDKLGRIDLSNAGHHRRATVVAWGAGDEQPAIRGTLRRSDSPYLRGENMPVVDISWFEADACCRFFGGALPTEAQWEKAGRGADGRLFPWGNDLEMTAEQKMGGAARHTTPHANLNRWRVMPVGSFPSGASVYGVDDLVGNVSEWVRDVYIELPNWDEHNPVGRGGAQDRRAERGSSTHDDDPQTAKLHNRRYSDPYKRDVDTRGFRLVLDPETALKMVK